MLENENGDAHDWYKIPELSRINVTILWLCVHTKKRCLNGMRNENASNREQTNNDPLPLSMTQTNFYISNETISRVHNNANRDSYNATNIERMNCMHSTHRMTKLVKLFNFIPNPIYMWNIDGYSFSIA